MENTNGTNKGRDLLLANKRRLFLEEQKGCRKGFGGTGELLYIDQHIFNERKTRRKNLAMAWIDNKKAYEMVPPSSIINCLKIYKILVEVINFIEKTMKTVRMNWQQEEKAQLKRRSKWYIPRRCTITITIYNCDDATQPHTRKIHSRIQT